MPTLTAAAAAMVERIRQRVAEAEMPAKAAAYKMSGVRYTAPPRAPRSDCAARGTRCGTNSDCCQNLVCLGGTCGVPVQVKGAASVRETYALGDSSTAAPVVVECDQGLAVGCDGIAIDVSFGSVYRNSATSCTLASPEGSQRTGLAQAICVSGATVSQVLGPVVTIPPDATDLVVLTSSATCAAGVVASCGIVPVSGLTISQGAIRTSTQTCTGSSLLLSADASFRVQAVCIG